MLSKTEQVWRHLLVASFEHGQNRHRSASGVARELGFGVSTVHRALVRPVEMGAVRIRSGNGMRVIDPYRLLLLWVGNRNLRADLLAERTAALPAPEVERLLPTDRFVLGGFGAVVAHQGGNLISGYDRVLCYGNPGDVPTAIRDAVPGETTIMVLDPDPLLRRYGRVTPLAQAFVDLCNVPGWPAARFVSVLTAGLLDAGVA